MKNWKVEVYYKPEVPDTVGQGILEDIADLGINGIDSVRTATVYWIEGALDAQTILSHKHTPSLLKMIPQQVGHLKYNSNPVSLTQWAIALSRASKT